LEPPKKWKPAKEALTLAGGIKRVLDEIWDEVLSHGLTDVIVIAINLLIIDGQKDM